MPRDIETKELRHLLRAPELRLHNGVLCIGTYEGGMVRITGYVDWLRVEYLEPNECKQCLSGDGE